MRARLTYEKSEIEAYVLRVQAKEQAYLYDERCEPCVACRERSQDPRETQKGHIRAFHKTQQETCEAPAPEAVVASQRVLVLYGIQTQVGEKVAEPGTQRAS